VQFHYPAWSGKRPRLAQFCNGVRLGVWANVPSSFTSGAAGTYSVGLDDCLTGQTSELVFRWDDSATVNNSSTDAEPDALRATLFADPPIQAPPPTFPACLVGDRQLVAYARAAGFTGDMLARAVAVALATSGGDARWWSGPNSSDVYRLGLWGITDKPHPSANRSGLLTDPALNASTFYADVTGIPGWGSAPAYVDRSYLKFLDRAASAAALPAVEAVACSDPAGAADPADTDEPSASDCSWSFSLGDCFRWAFGVSDDTQDRFADLGDDLGSKFPFGFPVMMLNLGEGFTECHEDDAMGCHADTRWEISQPDGSKALIVAYGGDPAEPAFIQGLREHRSVIGGLIWVIFLAPIAWSVFRAVAPLGSLAVGSRSGERDGR
jgi:hypothetical protein